YGRRRVARQFFGAPWPSADVDATTSALLDELVERARDLGAARIDDGGGRFDLHAAPVHCALGPLAMRRGWGIIDASGRRDAARRACRGEGGGGAASEAWRRSVRGTRQRREPRCQQQLHAP